MPGRTKQFQVGDTVLHERCEGEVVQATIAEISRTFDSCWVEYEVDTGQKRRGLLRLEELYQRNKDELTDPMALADFLVASDTRLVRAEYLWQLWRSRSRLLPRRQEAQEEMVMCQGRQLSALVTHREVQRWARDASSGSAGSPATAIFAVSHCWEMREHPDPFRHQLEQLVNFTSLHHVAHEAQQWLFYDYLSVFQFQRASGYEEEMFRLALSKMHIFYSHACTRTLRIESLTPEALVERKMKSQEKIVVFHRPTGRLAQVPLSECRTMQEHPAPCLAPQCALLHLNRVPYMSRGWCRVELEWSGMRGGSEAPSLRIDAEGKQVEMEEDGGDMRDGSNAMDLEFYNCKVAMAPEIFREQATSETLKFTHRWDLQEVMKLQKKVFLEKAATCRTLIQERLPDPELQILSAGLHHYKNLVSLTLRKCYFETEGARSLGEALQSAPRSLHSLHCTECRGGDVLAQALAPALGYSSLRDVVLAHDHISHQGAEALALALRRTQHLEELVLDHNHLGAQGAEALSAALKVNQTLVHLDLANNFIGYKGAEDLAASLMVNKTLRQLVLSFNNIKDKGAEALARALADRSDRSLRHLDLSSNDLREAAAEAFAVALKHGGLTRLDLGINRVGDEGAEALAHALRATASSLRHLDLSRNDLRLTAGEALAEALRVNVTLVDLDLSHNDLRQKGAEALASALRHENRTLRRLDLAENRIGYKVAEVFAEVQKVNREVEVVLEYEAEAASTAESGTWHGVPVAPVRCKALAKELRSSTALSSLNLSRDELGREESIQVLAEALSLTSSVRSLCLDGAEVKDRGLEVLSEALKKNTSIRILNLRDNLIGDAGIKALASALKRNCSIQLLKLELNEIGDEGVKALARALKINTSVRTVYLGNNEIGDEGIKALAEALKENTSVSTLGIRGKNILRINSQVSTLYLVHNEIGDDAIKALAEALKINTSVSQLYLGDHDLGDEGIKALEGLKESKQRQGYNLVLEY